MLQTLLVGEGFSRVCSVTNSASRGGGIAEFLVLQTLLVEGRTNYFYFLLQTLLVGGGGQHMNC